MLSAFDITSEADFLVGKYSYLHIFVLDVI